MRFTDLAERKGAEYAFDVLRVADLPAQTDLHLLGHVVGDELYKQQGIRGIALCTQEFRNACSHSIVIGVLNELGPSDATIEKIRDACTLAPGGSGAYTMCFHGLGHGVLAYFGYDLTHTVDFCKRLGTDAYTQQEYTQCVGGSVMELVGGGGHDREKWLQARDIYLPANDPLAPCTTALIPYEAKTFCFSYLTPQLFERAGANLASPDERFFPAAFAFCDALADTRLRTSCYGSFGKEFVPLAAFRDIRSVDALSNDQYRTAIRWCALAPSGEAERACVGEAVASIFWGGENDPAAAFRFCSLADENATSACWERLASDISSYAGERRSELCMRIPEAHRKNCS